MNPEELRATKTHKKIDFYVENAYWNKKYYEHYTSIIYCLASVFFFKTCEHFRWAHVFKTGPGN